MTAPPSRASDGFDVLLVEPRAENSSSLVEALEKAHDPYCVHRAESFDVGLQHLATKPTDLVLLDLGCVGDASAERTMLRIQSLRPYVPVIIVCDPHQQEQAFATVWAGAYDYLVRDHDDRDAVLRIVHRALQRRTSAPPLHESDQTRADGVHTEHHDRLTGLPNRARLEESLRGAIERPGPPPVVLALELDGFALVHDMHGQFVGDEVLRVVARRLRRVTRGPDVVARMAGDEFAILLEGASSPDAQAVISERVRAAVEAPIEVGDAVVHVSCAIGMAEAPPSDADLTRLIQQARQGTVRVRAEDALAGRDGSEVRLRGALKRREFHLHYQPQVQADGRLFGVEALIRWNHPDRTSHPGMFVPVLERCGLIHDVGMWVIETALEQLERWWAAGADVPRMAVNVSPRQLEDARFAEKVSQVLARSHVPAGALELEVTEGVALPDDEVSSRNMRAIRDLGVRLALDDFGTGYASLATLHRYAVDTLKLDQSFVADLETNPRSLSIVSTVLDLGRRLGITTIAEGVETEGQAELLRHEGCRVMQGFLFDQPRPGSVIPHPCRPTAPPSSLTIA